MGKYVKVHPNVGGQPVADDFKDTCGTWSHVIEDEDGDRVLFGAHDCDDDGYFEFDSFRLRVRDANGFRVFTWTQARELGETIIALADKHEEEE